MRTLIVKVAACITGALLLFAETGAPAPPQAAKADAPAPAAAWLEVTPLASNAEAQVLAVRPGVAAVPLENQEPGLALVCFGGEQVAVSCEQTYLAAGGSVAPRLGRGVRLAGVVTVGRLPVAGARVSLVPKSLRSARFVKLPLSRDAKSSRLVREVASGRDGRFRTPELAPGDYVLEVVPPGGRLFHGDPFTVPVREALLPKGPARPGAPEADAVLDLGTLDFDLGTRVEIFVTGPGGEPIAGARVGALQGASPQTSLFLEVNADAGGKAVLSGLDPALPVSLTCLADGYLVLRQAFDAPPGAFPCTLQPLAVVAGVVQDGEGRPVAGATASLQRAGRQTATGGDGRFSLSGLAPGGYRLVIAAPGFRVERIALELAAGDRRALPPVELLPGQEIRGVVLDARSKEPIADAVIAAVEPPGAASTRSDEEGAFILSLDDDEPLRLEVAAEGYPAKTVELPPEQARERAEPLVVELTPGGRIRVAVWDEEAEAPCQGCQVTISGEGPWRSVATDGSGEALSEPLAPGRYSLSPSIVESLGSVVTRRGGYDSKWVDVVSGATQLVQFGDRTPIVRIRFRPDPPEGWLLSARAGSVERVADRQGDRTFKLRKPVGAVALALSSGFGSTRVGALPEGDDRRLVVLPLPQATLRGTLLQGEEPLGLRRVEVVAAADPAIGGTALTSSDGAFAVPFLPPGVYAVLVDGRPLRSFALAEGDTEDLGMIRVGG